jgi:hypothetical protein
METQELLETFTFCQLQHNQEHSYRVTAHEHQYALECDGRFIAEIKCADGRWRQVNGAPLTKGFIAQIGDRIEDHYC